MKIEEQPKIYSVEAQAFLYRTQPGNLSLYRQRFSINFDKVFVGIKKTVGNTKGLAISCSGWKIQHT